MHVVLISVGSRGDAEPFCSIAASLLQKQATAQTTAKENGIQIDLFLQKDLTHLAPTCAVDGVLRVHELPFTQQDFYRFVASPHKDSIHHPNPRVQFVGIIAEVINHLVLPCYDDVISHCHEDAKGDLTLVASSLARPLALAVAAAHRRCRVALVQLQPLQPVPEFPHYSHSEASIEALEKLKGKEGRDDAAGDSRDENLESYWEPERFQHQFVLDRLSKITGDENPIDFAKDVQPALLGDRPDVRIVNAFSQQLIPPVGKAWHIGPLADAYVLEEPMPDARRDEFLKRRPICVGYGSMPFDKVSIVLSALEALNRPAVLVGSCFVEALQQQKEEDTTGSLSTWTQGNTYAVSSLPYPWLLPQCTMMLSHGGAGVVNATLRAGIPHVISPLMGDQFFWAQLLERRKLGVQADNLTQLTEAGVTDGIRRADAMAEYAKDIGEAIRADTKGVRVLVDHLLAWPEA